MDVKAPVIAVLVLASLPKVKLAVLLVAAVLTVAALVRLPKMKQTALLVVMIALTSSGPLFALLRLAKY